MALVVFLRGVNVGGHRTFYPSILAKELRDFDVVNIGAAGTFVVRKPGSRANFLAELRRKLSFKTEAICCEGRDLIRLVKENPFETLPLRKGVVRFVCILPKTARGRPPLPITLPERGKWLVRVIASKKQFLFGMYRREMKTIGYLGQIGRLFGAPAIIRNWNTMMAIVRVLNG